MNTTTPINKLIKNLNLLKQQNSVKTPVVLVMDSSVNPIHSQHINNFEIARKQIESQNLQLKIVAGYIAPSSSI
jgi:hypothetical protein